MDTDAKNELGKFFPIRVYPCPFVVKKHNKDNYTDSGVTGIIQAAESD
jgi:hypothetical protein